MKKTLKKQKRNLSQKTFRDSIKYLKKEEWQALKESIDNFKDKVVPPSAMVAGQGYPSFLSLVYGRQKCLNVRRTRRI